jgi:hypothetical protein
VAAAYLCLVRRMQIELQLWGRTIMVGILSAALIAVIYLSLARRMQLWGKAVLFGALSTAVIVLIYALPPYEYSGFAGANFAYNFFFFFPALLSSFLFWFVALALYLDFLRRRVGMSPSKIIVPPVLLLPFALQVTYTIILLIS